MSQQHNQLDSWLIIINKMLIIRDLLISLHKINAKQEMPNTTSLSPQQLIVTIEDTSVVNDIKRTIKLMRGVSKISVVKQKKTEVELAREDIKAGRVTKWNSVDDMFNGILGL